VREVIADTAEAIRERSERTVDSQAQRIRYAEVLTADPLTAELADGGLVLDEDNLVTPLGVLDEAPERGDNILVVEVDDEFLALGSMTDADLATRSAIRKKLIDAKGDLIAGTADNAVDRLAVGTDGWLLTADSAEPTGLKWAAHTAPAHTHPRGDLPVEIAYEDEANTFTLAGAAISLSSDSGYIALGGATQAAYLSSNVGLQVLGASAAALALQTSALADDEYRFTQDVAGKMTWGDGTLGNLDTSLYRAGVNALQTGYLTMDAGADTIWMGIYAPSPGWYGFEMYDDTNPWGRLRVRDDGELSWGDGTAPGDTNLYRSAANTLATDDDLIVGGGDLFVGTDAKLVRKAAGQVWIGTTAETNPVRIEDGLIRMKDNTDSGRSLTIQPTKINLGRSNAQGYSGLNTAGCLDVRDSADGVVAAFSFSAANNDEQVTVHNLSGGGGALRFFETATENLRIDTDGRILWGSTQDTNLYRFAANTLKTDDTFQAVTAGRFGSSSSNRGNLTVGDLGAGDPRASASVYGATPDGGSDTVAMYVYGDHGLDTGTTSTAYALVAAIGRARILATAKDEGGQMVSQARGLQGQVDHLSTSVALPTAQGVMTAFGTQASTTITEARHFEAFNSAQAGTIGTQYGLYLTDLDAATTNYGIYFAGTSGLARQGIWWNGDTNLYRSAANTLKTDDALWVVGNLQADADPSTGDHVGNRDYNDARYAASSHTHAQADVTNLVTDLAAKAPLASPALTGDPTAPTPTAADNDTSIATTAFVKTVAGGKTYLPAAIAYEDEANTFTANQTINADLLLGTGGQVDFAEDVGDKLLLYSNSYGIGIEASTLTTWSSVNHRWRVGGTSVSTGTEEMLLTVSTLDLKANTLTNLADPTDDAHVGDRAYNDARYPTAFGGYISVYDSTGGQTSASTTLVTLNLDTTLETDGSVFSLASDQVTCNVDGVMARVTYEFSWLTSGANAGPRAWLYLNGVAITGTRSQMFQASGFSGVNHMTALVALDDGDYLDIRFSRYSGTGTVTTTIETGRLTVQQVAA